MIRYAALTHPGNQLSHNEDAVACDTQRGLWVVADGMGGHAAGEVASEIATKTILQRFAESGSLADAISMAHRAIVNASNDDAVHAGMGSTVVALLIREQSATVAWVGDSRAYLWRERRLTQLSKDHSFLQELIDAGKVSEQEAREHPKRNVITQVLGYGNPRPSQQQVDLQPGDWMLLCSDGLTDVLSDEQIAQVLAADRNVKRSAQALVDAVCQQKPKDNVSAILVEPIKAPNSVSWLRKIGWLIAALLAVAVSILFLLSF